MEPEIRDALLALLRAAIEALIALVSHLIGEMLGVRTIPAPVAPAS